MWLNIKMVSIRLLGVHEHVMKVDTGVNFSLMPRSIYNSINRPNPAGISLRECRHRSALLASYNGQRYEIYTKARIPCYIYYNDTIHILNFYIAENHLEEIIMGNDNRYKIYDTQLKFFRRWMQSKLHIHPDRHARST